MVELSVIVATHNRGDSLRETIAVLAGLATSATWELIVVDNNSTDHTRAVVQEAARTFPVSLRYLFEPRGGKYHALNQGIGAAEGAIVAATDDDAVPRADWLDQAVRGLARFDCAFVGGPVFPLWRGARPAWLAERSSMAAKVLALQDYGREPREYGNGIAWPLGVNVAYRREIFDRVGLFDARLGRSAGTLRNQAQREWQIRAREAGATGYYLPEMIVHHVVWPDRLTKGYFRRWYYWHGVSRAIMYQTRGLDLIEPDAGAPARVERQVAGIPISILRRAGRSILSAARRTVEGDPAAAFEYEMWLCFCAGVARQRWRDRRLPAATSSPAVAH